MKKISIITFILIAICGQISSAGATDFGMQDQETPVKILSKPQPKVGRCYQGSGRTVLRVTFDKSEQITGTEIAEPSGCEAFDLNATQAAKGIKFVPATKNGEPVTVTKRILYMFQRM